MNGRISRVLAAFALAIALCSCSASSSTNAASKSSKERKPAPEFTLRDANGTFVKLSDYRGKVVLLNFWATWCGPCALEIPWFIEFEQEYKARGFEVLGISMDDDGWDAVKPYVSEHKMNYRVLLGDDSVSQLYGGVDALPTTFIIDRDGKIAFVNVGLAGKDEYLGEIQSLLGEKQAGLARGSVHPLAAALLIGPAK
jgi:peroxiredoxin